MLQRPHAGASEGGRGALGYRHVRGFHSTARASRVRPSAFAAALGLRMRHACYVHRLLRVEQPCCSYFGPLGFSVRESTSLDSASFFSSPPASAHVRPAYRPLLFDTRVHALGPRRCGPPAEWVLAGVQRLLAESHKVASADEDNR